MATTGYLFPETAGTLAADFRARQNEYAKRRSNFGTAEMDEAYRYLPKRNVFNTRTGYRLYESGKIKPSDGLPGSR